MRVHTLINDPIAKEGWIKEWIDEKGYTISFTLVYDGAQLPVQKDFDVLIILGGTMGAYEENKYPWLKSIKQLIKEAINLNKYVLGICLGAQLLAEILGGKVYPHTHKEIGWTEIRLTREGKNENIFAGLPEKLVVFQYHGDTFDLPADTVLLASGQGCRNQAFMYGKRVFGLQFHPEFTADMIEQIAKTYGGDIEPGPFVQMPSEFIGRNDLQENAKNTLFQILDNLEEIFHSQDNSS